MTRRHCATRTPAAAACAAFLLGACTAPPSDAGAASGGDGGESNVAPLNARYLTHILFAGAGGRTLFASFDQTADGDLLRRRYDVRMAGPDGSTTLMATGDTLPTPRAAWRILPAGDMSVRVGDAGQIVSLDFSTDGGEGEEGGRGGVRLVAGEEVSVWTGPTGQRESLGIAVLQTGEESSGGMLFFRRAARALSVSHDDGGGETFLFADSLGNGLLLHAGAGGEQVVAHTWLHGIEASWEDVRLEADSPPGSPREWRFEVAGTELRGRVRPVGPAAEVGGGAGRLGGADGGPARADEGAAPMIRLEAILRTGSDELRLTGLSAVLVSP